MEGGGGVEIFLKEVHKYLPAACLKFVWETRRNDVSNSFCTESW